MTFLHFQDHCEEVSTQQLIILQGVFHEELEPILEFMYIGRAFIEDGLIQDVLDVARDLELDLFIEELAKMEKIPAPEQSGSSVKMEEFKDASGSKMIKTRFANLFLCVDYTCRNQL